MNSPEIKKIIVVWEDGRKEEVKKGIVSKIDEGSGVQHAFVGLERNDFMDIMAGHVRTSVDAGVGVWMLNILAEAMMAKWLKDGDDEDAGGSGCGIVI